MLRSAQGSRWVPETTAFPARTALPKSRVPMRIMEAIMGLISAALPFLPSFVTKRHLRRNGAKHSERRERSALVFKTQNLRKIESAVRPMRQWVVQIPASGPGSSHKQD